MKRLKSGRRIPRGAESNWVSSRRLVRKKTRPRLIILYTFSRRRDTINITVWKTWENPWLENSLTSQGKRVFRSVEWMLNNCWKSRNAAQSSLMVSVPGCITDFFIIYCILIRLFHEVNDGVVYGKLRYNFNRCVALLRVEIKYIINFFRVLLSFCRFWNTLIYFMLF